MVFDEATFDKVSFFHNFVLNLQITKIFQLHIWHLLSSCHRSTQGGGGEGRGGMKQHPQANFGKTC
jgi:hypothetical protein